MAHLALYRTYRPQDFDAVVGQRHIIQTIKNQIKHDLLAHAYVLTGPRGTGKTSIARIVAKAINCSNPKAGNPCSSCKSCLAVANGSHPDVLELDGASNNGVEDIRDIRDRVKYSPSLSPYKVYIIDEVHMLSTGAFNALLKTLEEPPEHVIFMLATTEAHKVPDTILSRVQRFDLKQISTTEITPHLKRILQELDVKFEEGVPELVAMLAAGGLRDALSMLDQAIAYKVDKLTLSDVHDLNGSVDEEALVEIVEAILASDFAGVVKSTRALLAAGKLPARIIDGLLSMLRDVLKGQKIGGDHASDLAGKLTSEQVLNFIRKLNSLNSDLKIATDAELILEVGLLGLGSPEEVCQPKGVDTSAPKATENVAVHYDEQIKLLRSQVSKLQVEVRKLHRALPVPTTDMEVGSPIIAPPPEIPVSMSNDMIANDESDLPAEEIVVDDVCPEALNLDKGLLIEDILSHATMQDKTGLQNKLVAANSFAKLENKEVIMLLKDADIAAASSTGCVLVYDYETMVQKLLKDDNRNKAHRILADMLGRSYRFLALPKDFWLAQRENYVMQSKQGATPTLEQYPQTVVANEKKEEKSSSMEKPFYQDIADMFGDVVEVSE